MYTEGVNTKLVLGCKRNTFPVRRATWPWYIGIRVFPAVRSHNIHSPRRNENGYRSFLLPSCCTRPVLSNPSIQYNPVAPFFRRATGFPSTFVHLGLSRFVFPPVPPFLSFYFPFPRMQPTARRASRRVAPVSQARCFAASGQSNTFPAPRKRAQTHSKRLPQLFRVH